MIKKNFLFITSSCLIPILSFWSQNFGSTEEEENSCAFKNLGGTLPNRVCHIREFLKKVKSMPKPDTSIKSINTLKEFGEAYIFYGDTGIGKTTTAQLISEEANVLLEFHDEQSITQKIHYTKNPSAIIADIYENAEKRSEKEDSPVIIVIDNIDKLLKNNPDFIDSIYGALRSKIDKYENNPRILTILIGNSIKGMDHLLLRRCMPVHFSMPSQKNREKILKFYDSSLLNKQTKFFALITRNFSGGNLKKFVDNAKQYKEKQSVFPFGHSYLKTIASNTYLLKNYSIDTAKVAIYSATAVLMFLYRNKIARVVSDKWKKLFSKEKEKK